jgi:subtilisin family serine protease
MPDHGLFIAGIIRDLAPNANVECIRVLNDWCVGDGATLTKALEDIQNRMSQINPDTGKQGDLYKKPVVINLSLVIPADNEVVGQGIDLNLGGPNNVRAGLRKAMHTLVDLGAVLVASAANEADTRKGSKAMNAMRLRPDALYPAAFVYPPDSISGIIPVGAVDKNGNASSYSCYPGIRGVATYGGEVPTPYKRRVSDCLTEARKIDGLIGIYSSLSYPALSLDDCRSTYPVPNANGWAYWIGTSFATPIVTAIASRVLELNLRGKLSPIVVNVPSTVTNTIINSIARRQTIWDDLNPNVHPMGSASGNMILAVQQCLPAETEDEDEDMQINVTVVRRANGRNK